MAERFGDANPFAVHHLLGRAVWDGDTVRDELPRDTRGSTSAMPTACW
jgi:hypothetical protein